MGFLCHFQLKNFIIFPKCPKMAQNGLNCPNMVQISWNLRQICIHISFITFWKIFSKQLKIGWFLTEKCQMSDFLISWPFFKDLKIGENRIFGQFFSKDKKFDPITIQNQNMKLLVCTEFSNYFIKHGSFFMGHTV